MGKPIVDFNPPRYGIKKAMINLEHPCRGIDVWMVDTEEDEKIAHGQGYISIDEIREIAELSFEIDETHNFPYETWKWLQNRNEKERDSGCPGKSKGEEIDYSVIPYVEKE